MSDNAPTIYQICLKGRLDHQWSNWFEGLRITISENGDTLLTGPVRDQAALFGLLRKVRDTGMVLFSLNPIDVHHREIRRCNDQSKENIIS